MAEKFDGDALLHLPVGALGQEDLAGATTAQEANQTVGPHTVRNAQRTRASCGYIFVGGQHISGGGGDESVKRRAGEIEPQKGLDFRLQFRRRPMLLEIARTLGLGKVGQFAE